jgi:dCMP deaminase
MARPNRPAFPAYFLAAAQWAATRADCTRLQVGAVITAGQRVWASGYNGPPESGQPGCLAGACPRGQLSYEESPGWRSGNHDYSNCISVHAEVNAMHQFMPIRKTVENSPYGGIAHIWVTHEPCRACMELIRVHGLILHWPGHGYLECIDG